VPRRVLGGAGDVAARRDLQRRAARQLKVLVDASDRGIAISPAWIAKRFGVGLTASYRWLDRLNLHRRHALKASRRRLEFLALSGKHGLEDIEAANSEVRRAS
jgi:transposase